MGQLNVKKGNHSTPPEGSLGFGFDENSNPVIILEDGTEIPISISSTAQINIVANRGIGLEADLPADPNMGDVYVTTDTLKVYTYSIGGVWQSLSLITGQFITDISEVTELPPVYQYYNGALIPIANYEITLP